MPRSWSNIKSNNINATLADREALRAKGSGQFLLAMFIIGVLFVSIMTWTMVQTIQKPAVERLVPSQQPAE